VLIVAVVAILGLVAIVLALIISQHRLVTGDRVKIAPPPAPRQPRQGSLEPAGKPDASTEPDATAAANGHAKPEVQSS